MKTIDCEQGTPEWHAARAGRVTASRVADIVRKTKTGVSKMRQTYAGDLVAERLSGVAIESTYLSKPMQWGKDTEDTARAMYAFMNDVDPVRVGFVLHPTIEMAGASPDSLIDKDGLLEIKCPNCATHIETLRGGPIEPDYFKQMQWQMACAERAWCDFVSFDPRMPAEMQLHPTRVWRDDKEIAELEREVRRFLEEVDNTVNQLRTAYQLKGQLQACLAAE